MNPDPASRITASRNVMDELPRALGGPFGSALLRAEPEDFMVTERMRVPEHPTGAHWWMLLEKRGMNTRDVARFLAGLAGVRLRELGYAGLKDRHAVTQQWFSLPIASLDPEALPPALPDGLKLLEVRRARHAIRRGGLLGNRFKLRLRGLDGDRPGLERALAQVTHGVPNYFGEQRFGRNGSNLDGARRWLADTRQPLERHLRGLYLSAARSWVFNQVLARRVREGSWNRLLAGEAVILDGNRSWFPKAEGGDDLEARLARGDVHPSGPLTGTGTSPASRECARLESEELARAADWVNGLRPLGMRDERRALRLLPQAFLWRYEKDDLLLSFDLPKGCYATAVVRELVETRTPGATP